MKAIFSIILVLVLCQCTDGCNNNAPNRYVKVKYNYVTTTSSSVVRALLFRTPGDLSKSVNISLSNTGGFGHDFFVSDVFTFKSNGGSNTTLRLGWTCNNESIVTPFSIDYANLSTDENAPTCLQGPGIKDCTDNIATGTTGYENPTGTIISCP